MRLLLLFASVAFSQDWQTAAGGKMSFDVASIKPDSGPFHPPNFPLDPGDAYKPTGGRFSADFGLVTYIRFAYKLAATPGQVEEMIAHLPKWVTTERFAIEARTENPNPTKDQMRLMMQSLLADRFRLQVHFETREMPVFALMLVRPGKTGPGLRPHDQGPPCDRADPNAFPSRCDVYEYEARRLPGGLNRAGARNTTMELIAGAIPGLEQEADRPVVDHTGLSGKFDFKLEWSLDVPDPDPHGNVPGPIIAGPPLLVALRQQLGLKLESTRAPVKTLIIDHVERPTEN